MEVSPGQAATPTAYPTLLTPPTTQAFKAYAFGTAAYLTLQSLPLLLAPRLVVSMLAAEPRRMTDLESYLSRSLGFSLLSLALLCILLTGSVPLTNMLSDEDEEGNVKNPYALPTVIVTTTYHAMTAMYIYAQITYRLGSFGFYAGMVASSALFCFGVWVIVFGSEKGKISKTTGADKRTGNFPFANTESSREKKKESKRKSVTRGVPSRG